MSTRLLLVALSVLAVLGLLVAPSLAREVRSAPIYPVTDSRGGIHDHTDAKDANVPPDALAVNCDDSKLPPHDGFESAPACVSTAFGEVSDAAHNPSLLIVDAPRDIKEGSGFTLKVSTRNLVRDRFLAADQGGYYIESSLLNKDGLQRGHYHVACGVLDSDKVAPVANRTPEFFKAVEDGKGGARPDTTEIDVPGHDDNGALFHNGDLVRCAAWAGDGSHRMPMMQFASETPAFDSVRVRVED